MPCEVKNVNLRKGPFTVEGGIYRAYCFIKIQMIDSASEPAFTAWYTFDNCTIKTLHAYTKE